MTAALTMAATYVAAPCWADCQSVLEAPDTMNPAYPGLVPCARTLLANSAPDGWVVSSDCVLHAYSPAGRTPLHVHMRYALLAVDVKHQMTLWRALAGLASVMQHGVLSLSKL